MYMRIPAALAAASALSMSVLVFSHTTAAEAMRSEVEITVEVEADTGFRSTDADERLTDTYNTTELAAAFYISKSLSVHAGLTLEPVLDPAPGADRQFNDIGLYVDTLMPSSHWGKVSMKVGKFGPAFGVGWDKAPGLYGTEFAEDYELSEQLGVAVATSLGGIEIEAASFTLDRTALARSIFTSRRRPGC